MSVLSNRTLVAVSCAVSATFIGIGMVVPVRVLYAQSHGASLAIIGAMASSFLLSNFLFQYPASWLADFWGRKRMMVIGLVAQAGISLVYLAVTDPVLFVVLRFFEGVVAASVLPSARALITQSVPPDRQGEAYGVFSSFLNAGFLIGPALGGLFATFGYSSAFVGSTVFRLVAVVIVVTLVPRESPFHAADRARARGVSRRALFTPALLGAYIVTFGDNIFFGFDLTLFPLWMKNHLGASVALIGLAYAMWALPNIVGAPFGGRLADRMRRSILIFVFGLAQVPLYAALGFVRSAVAVLIIFVIHGAVYSLIQPAVDAHLAKSSPPAARARAQGMYSAMGLASAFIAANVLPWLYGIDIRLPLFVMAGGLGVSVIIGGSLVRYSERLNQTSNAGGGVAVVAD